MDKKVNNSKKINQTQATKPVKKAREMIISENKTLKLHNVFRKPLTEKEIANLPRTFQMIEGYIKASALEPVGPLITYSKVKIEDEVPRTYMEILGQLKNKPKSKLLAPYIFNEEERIESCLFTKFIGEQQDMELAFYKMQVYAYEHYIKLKGGTYTVYLSAENGIITCDIFAEVK